MSNPLKLHFMLYMFHAHQATVHIATACTKFVLKRSDDCDYVIYAVPPMREIPCFIICIIRVTRAALLKYTASHCNAYLIYVSRFLFLEKEAADKI